MILVLHQGAIGDFLLTLPVVQAVRAVVGDPSANWCGTNLPPVESPDSEGCTTSPVTAIASAASARLAAGRSAVDRWHSPEQVGLHALFGEDCSLSSHLDELLGQARLVLSFLGDTTSLVHRKLRGATAAKVISIDPRPTEETLSTGTHISVQWTTDLRRQGLDIGKPRAARIAWPRSVRPAESPGMRIVIHPGSGGRGKCWPADHFTAVADALHQLEPAYETAWMLGPAEREAGDDRFIDVHRRCSTGDEHLIVETELNAAAAHLAEAKLYLGNDGGMTHLAAALGVPTVAVFCSTDPRVWRPLGNHVRAVSKPTPDRILRAMRNFLR